MLPSLTSSLSMRSISTMGIPISGSTIFETCLCTSLMSTCSVDISSESTAFPYKTLSPIRGRNRQTYTLSHPAQLVTPEAVLKSIEAVAPKRGLPIIGPKRGVYLDESVKEHHPATILEVGTLVGYSAIRMGRLLKPGQKITCIEVKEEMVQEARSNIKMAGLSDRIEVLHGDARKVIPTLKGPFDIVYLDAVKEDYLAYLKLSE